MKTNFDIFLKQLYRSTARASNISPQRTFVTPGATRFYERCLSLPLFPAMEDADVERVVDALAKIIGRSQ
jgi:dTDP-4-amino-4,6-dideoxygalactose transaminase